MLGPQRFLSLKLLALFFAVGSLSTLFASGTPIPGCGPASLASYIATTATPSGGCSIGILDYYNVAYLPGTNAPAASAINVATEGQGFTFGPVSAAPGQTVSFEIDYQIYIDPVPVITGDNLGLDVTGNITVTEYFCNDSRYLGDGLCLGHNADVLQVGNGNGLPNTKSIIFSDPAHVSEEVGIVFTLIGGTDGASFDGLNSASIVTGAPEPASIAFTLFGIATLAGGYKLGKRSNR